MRASIGWAPLSACSSDAVSEYQGESNGISLHNYQRGCALPLAALLAGLSALPVFATEKHALGFDVAISLSSKAEAALKSTHEGISLSATYYGEPHPGDEKHTNAMGMVDLGSRLIDIQSQNRTVAASATAERNTVGHRS